MSRVPYNKLLTNLACSSRTGEYWPSVVFVRTSRSSVRTVTTSGQYSPVRPSRSVSKRLLILQYATISMIYNPINVVCQPFCVQNITGITTTLADHRYIDLTLYLTIIPRARAGYEVSDLVDSQGGAWCWFAYNHLISSKREWHNCFIKNAS